MIHVLAAFVICLVLAYVAEEFFGVADITGAFIAGLIVSNTAKTEYINDRYSFKVSTVILTDVAVRTTPINMYVISYLKNGYAGLQMIEDVMF